MFGILIQGNRACLPYTSSHWCLCHFQTLTALLQCTSSIWAEKVLNEEIWVQDKTPNEAACSKICKDKKDWAGGVTDGKKCEKSFMCPSCKQHFHLELQSWLNRFLFIPSVISSISTLCKYIDRGFIQFTFVKLEDAFYFMLTNLNLHTLVTFFFKLQKKLHYINKNYIFI